VQSVSGRLNLTASWTAIQSQHERISALQDRWDKDADWDIPHPTGTYNFSVTVPDQSVITLTFVLAAVDSSNQQSADSTPVSYSYPGWVSIAGSTPSPPALAWNPVAQTLHIVVRGGNDSIWTATFNSDGAFNNDWVPIPGAILSSPALAWNPLSQTTQMVVQGGGNSIWSAPCPMATSI
jgi:hypothetical protein